MPVLHIFRGAQFRLHYITVDRLWTIIVLIIMQIYILIHNAMRILS